MEEKLKLTESLLQGRVIIETLSLFVYLSLFTLLILIMVNIQNLEIKKINEEKKASMVAQFAAEATLRRVHAAQKDDDMPPIEAILAPLEAELKLARSEVFFLKGTTVYLRLSEILIVLGCVFLRRLGSFRKITEHWIVSLNQKKRLCLMLRELFKLPWLKLPWLMIFRIRTKS